MLAVSCTASAARTFCTFSDTHMCGAIATKFWPVSSCLFSLSMNGPELGSLRSHIHVCTGPVARRAGEHQSVWPTITEKEKEGTYVGQYQTNVLRSRAATGQSPSLHSHIKDAQLKRIKGKGN